MNRTTTNGFTCSCVTYSTSENYPIKLLKFIKALLLGGNCGVDERFDLLAQFGKRDVLRERDRY